MGRWQTRCLSLLVGVTMLIASAPGVHADPLPTTVYEFVVARRADKPAGDPQRMIGIKVYADGKEVAEDPLGLKNTSLNEPFPEQRQPFCFESANYRVSRAREEGPMERDMRIYRTSTYNDQGTVLLGLNDILTEEGWRFTYKVHSTLTPLPADASSASRNLARLSADNQGYKLAVERGLELKPKSSILELAGEQESGLKNKLCSTENGNRWHKVDTAFNKLTLDAESVDCVISVATLAPGNPAWPDGYLAATAQQLARVCKPGAIWVMGQADFENADPRLFATFLRWFEPVGMARKGTCRSLVWKRNEKSSVIVEEPLPTED